MAIQWGAWEGASPNRIRVGIDVEWTAANGGDITVNTASAKATVKIYTDVEGNWSDDQTLNFGGAIGGSVSFTNNQSNNRVLRETKTYTYDYGDNEYGSSPGSRTFSANLTGAFNGATPSKSVTSDIPKRPYGAPNAPSAVSVTRISDISQKVSWTNNATTARPWDRVRVQIDGAANDLWNGDVGTPGGSSTSFTDTGNTVPNEKYKYRVRAEGPGGNSDPYVETSVIYTTPAAPTDATRTDGTLPDQVVSWTNTAGYAEYSTEIQRGIVDPSTDAVTWTTISTVVADTTSYTDTAAQTSQKTRYRVRHRTTAGVQGTLYSDYSNETTTTPGVVSAPNPPTGLSPTGNALIAPAQPRVFTWVHNPTDSTAQTAYQIQWRVVGAGSWTVLGKIASTSASWTAPANTFPDNSTIEWQVRTWGAATSGGSDGTGASDFSASSVFKVVGDPNAARVNKRVLRYDLETNQEELAPAMALPPIGSLMLFAGAAAPQGWLLCQGQSLARADYPDLFAVLGTTYGSEDSTRFTLPDLRDRVPMGASTTKAPGTTGGSDTVTIGAANLPPHAHDDGTLATSTNGSHDHALQYTSTDTGNAGSVVRGGVAEASWRVPVSLEGDHSHDVTGNTGNGPGTSTPLDVKPRYQALNYIIRT